MASLLLRVSPQMQISFRRAFATTPPPEVLPQSESLETKHARDTEHANLSSSAELKIKAKADTEADMDSLMILLKGHKKQRLAIATVNVAAVSADVTFTYFTFFHGRKEGEAIRTDTVFDALAQKVGPHLISEEGLGPMEK